MATHEFAHILASDLYEQWKDDANIDHSILVNGSYVYDDTIRANKFYLFKPYNLDVWSRYFLGWINPKILTTFDDKTQSLISVNDYRCDNFKTTTWATENVV